MWGLQCGVSNLVWGLEGYKLVVTEAGGNCQVLELTLCKSLPNSHRIPMHDSTSRDDNSWRPPEVYILQVRVLGHRPRSSSLPFEPLLPLHVCAGFALPFGVTVETRAAGIKVFLRFGQSIGMACALGLQTGPCPPCCLAQA